MLCKIADLFVEIPDAGGFAPRYQDYAWNDSGNVDIVINSNLFHSEFYPAAASQDLITYMESGRLFSVNLLRYCGFSLHASAVELDGHAYLFSGPSGIGKSTHTHLWQTTFGSNAHIINDDKPAIRRIDGKWYAYGTPWCGKNGLSQNVRVPLAGICFLKQSPHNSIRLLNTSESLQNILSQTIHRFQSPNNMELMLALLDNLVTEIPVFLLENLPNSEAAQLSYNTMRCKAGENNL